MPETVTFSLMLSVIWTTLPVSTDPLTRELTLMTLGGVVSTIAVTADVVVVLPALSVAESSTLRSMNAIARFNVRGDMAFSLCNFASLRGHN